MDISHQLVQNSGTMDVPAHLHDEEHQNDGLLSHRREHRLCYCVHPDFPDNMQSAIGLLEHRPYGTAGTLQAHSAAAVRFSVRKHGA